MIPKKLYIPTSTLNFNNIMSSESISPAAFYANRRFGYKRFEKVVPNKLDNLILLYDKYPLFDINDKEMENYPMVIEIDTQDIPEDYVQEKNGVFFTDRTIYLNPFSTRIIFRTVSDRTLSLSKAEPSIESKLIPLYRGRFIVLSDEIEKFNWTPIHIDDLPTYDNNAVSFDIAINKLKGMLYGYLLGANGSCSNKVVSVKRKVKNLRNVLSAILASPDGRVTKTQEQQLDGLYKNLNRCFYELSGVQSHVNEIIAKKNEYYQTQSFLTILKGEGLYQVWFKKQVAQLNLCYSQIQPFNLSNQSIDKVAELDTYIDNIERIIQTYDVKTKIDKSKLPVVQNCRITEIPSQKDFLVKLFNEYMSEAWNGAEFLSSRYEFAKNGGKLFRESAGDKWETSPARTYINSLLKNLNEFTEFDINSTESDILKSFAAFCQKGESDIDKFRDYLISNGIGDFRIAFALWGLIFGFAEMPKTLTNELFESQNVQYIEDYYRYIYKQLHKIELDGTSDRIPKVYEKPVDYLDENKTKDIDESEGKTERQIQDVGNSVVKSEPEHGVTPIPDELIGLFDSESFKKLSPKAQHHFKTESLNLYNRNSKRIDTVYINELIKIEYPKSKTCWKKAIKDWNQKRKSSKKQNPQHTLFFQESTGIFLQDFDFLRSNQDFIELVSGIDGWENDLKWYIDAHNPNHKDYSYYEGKPTDNGSVIKRFIHLKKEKYKITEGFLMRTYVER